MPRPEARTAHPWARWRPRCGPARTGQPAAHGPPPPRAWRSDAATDTPYGASGSAAGRRAAPHGARASADRREARPRPAPATTLQPPPADPATTAGAGRDNGTKSGTPVPSRSPAVGRGWGHWRREPPMSALSYSHG